MTTNYKPKLIEVALPLATINAEAARDKSIRNHPQSLHRWWARRPLAAARAVIWASLVDDPSCDESLTEEQQERERQRLFKILERLVVWENSNNPEVLAEARAEIERCFPNGAPPILDPFGGGGAIPLEAQRLGLVPLSGDLNPVAVLIQKAMIEIPPRFAGCPPIHPDIENHISTWERAQGLAADVEAYGKWMQDEAYRRIGHLYPDTDGPNGERLTPIAWVWARTVESPDPTWHGHVPLVSSWYLSKKKGNVVWVDPVVDQTQQCVRYRIRRGGSPTLAATVNRGNGTCLGTGAAIPGDYIKAESRAGRMGQQLIAIVAEGSAGRQWCEPTAEAESVAFSAAPAWRPEGKNPEKLTGGTVFVYGLNEWQKLFSERQLVGLTTLSDLTKEVRFRIEQDARAAGYSENQSPLRDGGNGASAYAEAVVTYLAFALDKALDFNSTLSTWDSTNAKIRNVFARQSIAMTWDYAECNLLGDRVGSFWSQVAGMRGALEALPTGLVGAVRQLDARAHVLGVGVAAISTDPPYYDNISYADLSDFFFVWLRRNLSDVWPDECATLLTPKAHELIANQHRAGSRQKAEEHFESGMAEFMAAVAKAQCPDVPATIYYAYKATETKDGEIRSTGWDTFLQGVIDAGMQVTATWPMRTELGNRLLASKSNALASSIVLACRPRTMSAPLASRGEFVSALRAELPEAVRILQTGNIAPVDLAQSTIGPGVRVFSRYGKVIDADGSAMSVSDALAIINDVLGEVLDGEEAELDRDTRFAVTWYTQNGYNPGRSGDADAQARAKNTSLSGLLESGIGETRAGDFRLLERSELDPGWDSGADDRLTVWEATQHLVAALDRSESEAAELLHRMGGHADRARQLAYVLFQRATDKGWAEEAGAYNGLITAWPSLQVMGGAGSDQGRLL